jgi:cob(I)alamin adenosyltransferase
VTLSKEMDIKPEILQYLNRLSDTLFMLARYENKKAGIEEEKWVTKK